jgi:cell division ATPase FtsA
MKSIIVLDIGTQFVKGLIFEIKKDGKEKIFRAAVDKSNSEDIFLSCQKAIKILKKKSGIKPEEIFLGIGNDILKGRTTTLCYKRENPNQKFDLAELKYLIQKIEWKALDTIRKEFVLETEFKDTDARLIDAFVLDIKIDGRSIVNPIGMNGQQICLSVYNTYIASKNLEEMRKLLGAIKLKSVGFIPVPYALFSYLDLEKSQKGDALIIDIGAKTTEITLIENGGEVIETRSFHLGGQALTRVLADFLGMKPSEAEAVKNKYSNKEVSLEVKKKFDKLFAPNISSWQKGVKFVLEDFYKKYKFLPSKIFLCGGGSNFPLIENSLKKEKEFKILKLEEDSCSALKRVYDDWPDGENIFLPILKRVIKLIQNQ